jgi:hypothetical protein
MFEAHFTKAEDFQGLETVSNSWKSTYYRRHKTSFQPLRIWFAHGKRKLRVGGTQPTLFIYIEYPDAKGNNQYHCLEVASDWSVAQALGLATKVALP